MLVTIYLIFTLLFGGLLVFSFLLGEFVEGVGEAVESAGNAVEGFVEGILPIDIELTGNVELGTPGTSRSILVFITFFCGGGYIALTQFGTSAGVSVLVGLGFGLVGGVASYALLRYLAYHEVTSAKSPSDYVGRKGLLTADIAGKGRLGTVSLSGPLGTEVFTAIADKEISRGTEVIIISVSGIYAKVESIDA